MEGIERFALNKHSLTYRFLTFNDWFKWIEKISKDSRNEDIIFQNDQYILLKCTRSKVIHFTDQKEGHPPISHDELNLPVVRNGWSMENTRCFEALATSSSFKVYENPFEHENYFKEGNFKVKLRRTAPGEPIRNLLILLFVCEE